MGVPTPRGTESIAETDNNLSYSFGSILLSVCLGSKPNVLVFEDCSGLLSFLLSTLLFAINEYKHRTDIYDSIIEKTEGKHEVI